MNIKLIGDKKTLLVRVDCDLDHHVASQIRKNVDGKIKTSNAVNVIFDFSNVDFMDSSGIGVIMGRYKMTKILGGKVVIIGVNKQIQRIIEMAGIDKLICVCESYDEALTRV